MRTVVYDEELDIDITIELICTCGLPVARLSEEGEFYCLHCDRFCATGKEGCTYCVYAMQDRVSDYDDEGLGPEGD